MKSADNMFDKHRLCLTSQIRLRGASADENAASGLSRHIAFARRSNRCIQCTCLVQNSL